MAQINLRNIFVEFPVYNGGRSLKKHFLKLATGGSVIKDANEHILVKALNDVSLSIHHGERIGLIGHNGSGKSTFLRLLSGIYEPTQGQIKIEGKISSLLDYYAGIEAEFTGYENIYMRGALLGLDHDEIKSQVENITEFSGLGGYLNMPVRTYSAGMKIRLAFAITTSIKPEILLLDEVFGAGDADFYTRAHERMISLLDQSSIVVMASHADGLIKEFCNKTLLLENGQIKFYGETSRALDIYHGKEKIDGDQH